MKRLFLAILGIILLGGQSMASISFTSGKWETTFNCAEQSQFISTLNCNGMEWAHNYTLVPGKTTQIISDANNTSGGGGNGARFWVGSGQNNNTGTIRVQFPNYQKELWIRWYARHQSGWSYSTLEDDKNLYIWSAGNITQVIPEFYENSYRLTAQATPDPNPVITNGYGWNNVMGGSSADGLWHCFEIHLKMDTNGVNGIGHFWVDGILRASNTAVNWSNNNSTAKQGWDNFYFEENQKYVSGGPYYVDYDDMVIYNTTPPNVDASGNPMIGPLSSTPVTPPTTSTITPSGLIFSESFESAISEGVRGWIDGNMSNIVSGGKSGNAMKWAWAQGATQPTSSNTIRYTLPSDKSQMLVRMYVKYDSNWVGSGVDYHPHESYIVSNQDVALSAYGPLANNYLTIYKEAISDTISPYSIRPLIGYQDNKRVNTALGTPPNNLRGTTGNRSTGYCNQPTPSGWSGTCFVDSPYYSASTYKNSSISIPKNEWVLVDTFIKMNTISNGIELADGQMKMWINGTLVANSNDVMFKTNQNPALAMRQFVFAPLIGDGSPIAQSMYIDELSIYDGYVESSAITCYKDADNDLYGDGTSESVSTCSPNYYIASHFVSTTGDCNDSNSGVRPGATDLCTNLIDDDCDGTINEGCSISYITCYKDIDNDLYGDGTSESVVSCSSNYYISSHFISASGDCNDSNPYINPTRRDICDSVDNNCNGFVDEGCGIGKIQIEVGGARLGTGGARLGN